MTTRILKALAAISLILLLSSAPAFSAPISFDFYEFTGEIIDDFGVSNPFGVSLGDAIDGNTIFPGGVIQGTVAPGEDYFLADVGATLTFNIGSLQLTEADDSFAQAFFTDALLTGFEYQAFFNFGRNDYEFAMFGSGEGETAFTIFDDYTGDFVLEGNFFDLQDGVGSVQVVPIPGTLILLGTGLAGLMGARRKFNKN